MALTCKICDKSFKFQSSYSRHGRIHKALKLTCDCGRTFARRDGLKRHQLIFKCYSTYNQEFNNLKSDNSQNVQDVQVSEVSDIAYSQIRDDFWNANYLGLQVIMMKSNGYINATKLCVDGGKRFDHWLDSKHSKEMVYYYEKILSQE